MNSLKSGDICFLICTLRRMFCYNKPRPIKYFTKFGVHTLLSLCFLIVYHLTENSMNYIYYKVKSLIFIIGHNSLDCMLNIKPLFYKFNIKVIRFSTIVKKAVLLFSLIQLNPWTSQSSVMFFPHTYLYILNDWNL